MSEIRMLAVWLFTGVGLFTAQAMARARRSASTASVMLGSPPGK